MIEIWLKEFSTAWIVKDLAGVLRLFGSGVEYWETPYKKLQDRTELEREWSAITGQQNVELNTQLFAKEADKYTVLWRLSYENENNEVQDWAGVYLIRLDAEGKCIYFYQTGERA